MLAPGVKGSLLEAVAPLGLNQRTVTRLVVFVFVLVGPPI